MPAVRRLTSAEAGDLKERSSLLLAMPLEHLRPNLSGQWSRRIADEHQPAHTVVADSIFIIHARYLY